MNKLANKIRIVSANPVDNIFSKYAPAYARVCMHTRSQRGGTREGFRLSTDISIDT